MSDTLQQKLDHFNDKKFQILAVSARLEDAQKALQARIDEFVAPLRGTVDELSAQLNRLREEYKAESKAAWGIADGEQLNVLEVIEAMARVKNWQ